MDQTRYLRNGLCLWLLFFSSRTQALLMTPESVQKEKEKSHLHAVVEVVSSHASEEADIGIRQNASAIIRKIHFAKSESNDLHLGNTIEIENPGGESKNLGVLLSGVPHLLIGHQYELYLQKTEKGAYKISAYEFGMKDLAAQRSFSRNRTDGSNGDGNGAFLFWDDSLFPIPYFISEPTLRGHAEWISFIDQSFQSWRNVDGTRIEFSAMGCSNGFRNENDGINNVILISDKWPFDSAAIAITRNFYVSGESNRAGMILDSDILLNGVNHQFTTTGETGKHDVQNIMTHEIGHFIGLGHEAGTVDLDATMYANATAGETKKRELHRSDISGLMDAYKGVASKPGVGSTSNFCDLSANQAKGCMAVHQTRTSVPTAFLILFTIWITATLFVARTRWPHQ